ncbi:MAG TPA: radical SAM protein [Roseimicrobium sp.]|nr:radical SAM protein [Roseimicrobium sp.]
MIHSLESLASAPAKEGRQAVALSRFQAAHDSLACCQLCSHRCGANRLAGETGPCHATTDARVFMAQTEVSDELELIPVFAIALGGCDLRCSFCITGQDSWNVRSGKPMDVESLAGKARTAIQQGARSIMILGGEPTIHLPTVLRLVAALPGDAKLIWKTNAHGTQEARDLLAGLFDVWVADYKFGNDVCAERLARIPRYSQIVRENLLWAATNTDLIIRHVLMPGHIDCCWAPVARWIAENLPRTRINLRSGFWPAWQSGRHPELMLPLSPGEEKRARRLGTELGLQFTS